jgi:hypothetical protein
MTVVLNLTDEYYNFYNFLNLTNMKNLCILNMFSEAPSMCLNFDLKGKPKNTLLKRKVKGFVI